MAETVKYPMSLQPEKKQQKGTGYTNIQNVLKANEGNRLGSTVSSGLQQQAQSLKDQSQKQQEAFSQGLQQNRLDTPEARAAREAAIERIRGGQGVTDQDVSQFTKFRAGEYSGPKGLEDEQSLMARAGELAGTGRDLITSQGRRGILQQFVGQAPAYTAGKSRLDELLLGQSPEQIKEARRSLTGLGRQTFKDITSARGQGQATEQAAHAFGTETGNILNRETGALDTEIQKQMDEAQKAEEARKSGFQSIQDILSGTTPAKTITGTPGQQPVGGAAPAQNRVEQALNQLKETGLLNDEQINSLRGVTSGTSKAEEPFYREQLDRLIVNKKIAAEQGSKSAKAELKKYQAAAKDPAKFQAWMQDQKTRYPDSPSVKAGQFGEQDLANIIKNTLTSQDAYGLGQKTAFVDPAEAARYNALAKLSGKAETYNQAIDPNALYRAGSAGTEQSKISDIQNLLSGITKAQQASSQTPQQRINEMTRLANLLRGYSEGTAAEAPKVGQPVITY